MTIFITRDDATVIDKYDIRDGEIEDAAAVWALVNWMLRTLRKGAA